MLVPTTTQHLVLTEYNATVKVDIAFDAGLDTLVITEHNVTVDVVNLNITAGLDALVITEYPAVVKVDIAFTAGLDVLIITEYNPVILAGFGVYATVDTLILTSFSVTIDDGLLSDLINEISSSSRMVKELKGSSEMSL